MRKAGAAGELDGLQALRLPFQIDVCGRSAIVGIRAIAAELVDGSDGKGKT